jgi:hypothetical protein
MLFLLLGLLLLGWLNGLPFLIVEDETFCFFAKMISISVNTLHKYLDALTGINKHF